MRGIHRGPVNSPHKRPVTRKMFPSDDVIMIKELENSTHPAMHGHFYEYMQMTQFIWYKKSNIPYSETIIYMFVFLLHTRLTWTVFCLLVLSIHPIYALRHFECELQGGAWVIACLSICADHGMHIIHHPRACPHGGTTVSSSTFFNEISYHIGGQFCMLQKHFEIT